MLYKLNRCIMRKISLGFSLLLATLVGCGDPASPPSASGDDVSPSPASAETAAGPVVYEPAERLMAMAKYLADTPAFRVNMRVGYEVVQASGQKIEFGEKRSLAVNRPDQMRVDVVASNGIDSMMLIDGSNITVMDGEEGVYAQAPQPGNIDAAVMYFVRALQMRLPLAPLLLTTFPDELDKRIQAIDLVETTDILGQSSHHLAARTANVDFQVWIADGAQPLPLRIVLTYPQEEGQPQFWADFSDWNMAPQFDADSFAFKVPTGARQIAYAAQFATSTDDAPSPTAIKGETP